MRFGSKLTAVAVLAVAGAIGSQAQASILSFSDLSASGLNAGTYVLGTPSLTTGTGSYYYSQLNYLQTVSNFSVVTVPPTTTSAGLALDYTKTTTSYTDRVENYKQDFSSVSVTSSDSTIGSGKYLSITGKIKSSEDTRFSFSLSADGNYGSTTIPGVGSVPNGSVSFFAGPDALSYAAQLSTTAFNPADATFYSYASNSLLLKKDVEVSFAALVYSSNASLSEFTISGYSGEYGRTFKDTPYASSYDTLVGSHLLSPTPEPETYAMLLAGLGLMGGIARRRRVNAA